MVSVEIRLEKLDIKKMTGEHSCSICNKKGYFKVPDELRETQMYADAFSARRNKELHEKIDVIFLLFLYLF